MRSICQVELVMVSVPWNHGLLSSSSLPKQFLSQLISLASEHTHLPLLNRKSGMDFSRGPLLHDRSLLSCLTRLLVENVRSGTIHLQLLAADTAITRNTATNILPPSYQPSFKPSSLMPKARERAAQTSKMRMVVSLKASTI